MAEKVTFNVLRRHEGDQLYEEGDTRAAVAAEVAHLVDLGVLEKAAAKPKNKAEPVAANKADPLDHDRDGRKGGAAKAKG
jgi:hypothetical protein